ncbi:MAG: acetamidase/formamidase family protein [Bacteroidota bacterium]
MKSLYPLLLWVVCIVFACDQPLSTSSETSEPIKESTVPTPDHTLTSNNTHNKFSADIPPILTVKSGAVIEAYTKDASDNQFDKNSTLADLDSLDFEPIHPLTGPVFVQTAMPGDILKVTIHEVELGDWGWNAVIPGFGFLADSFPDMKYLRIYEFTPDTRHVDFTDEIDVPLNPFPGVLGVAPPTTEMLSTIPPRANGGNMDDPNLTEGTVVYLPVFVEGALLSIGDGHAAQGHGEVCGTAIEVPLRVIYEVEVLKGRSISEPQYETEEVYATTGFATTTDEAARKATMYMVRHLESQHGLSTEEAYVLCSLAGDLLLSEVVDVPHMLATMHMPKAVIGE